MREKIPFGQKQCEIFKFSEIVFFFTRSDKPSEIFFFFFFFFFVKARFCIRIVCISIISAYFLTYSKSGPSCSKLTMSLVNDSLKFTSSDTQIR